MHTEYTFDAQLTSLKKGIFIAILHVLLQSNSLAAGGDLQKIDASTDYQQINKSLYILRDPSAKLTLNDILQGDGAVQFKKFTGDVPSFGHISDALWFRFTLENNTNEALEKILQIGVAWMDYIDLYLFESEGGMREFHHSDLLPFSNRSTKHNLPVFTLNLEPGETTVFLHIVSVDAILAPISLWKPSAWQHQDRLYNLVYGALFGAVIIMILYNALLYVFLKIPVYLFYICYLATFFASNFTYNGFAFEFLWPDHPQWTHWFDSTMIYLYQITGVMFVMSLLNTKETSPQVHRFLGVFLIVIIAVYILTAIIGGYALHTVTGINFIYFYSFILVVIGLNSWYQGNRVARFFVFASISGFIGISLTASVALGILPFTPVTYHGAEFGMLIDMTLLSMALADRYNILREEKALVEHRYLETVKAAKVILEKEVAKQTGELRLEKEKAEQMARTDELTGMYNRRAYYEASINAFNLARRHNYPASVIILDIDKFKEINDTCGHAIGDIVLKMVGRAILKSVRKTDIAGRLGGEEFALLLPQTALNIAADLAEKLRTIIGQIGVNHGEKKVLCTASFGVCQMQTTDECVDDLIARADKAMYEAKESGRNKVVKHEESTKIHTLFQSQ